MHLLTELPRHTSNLLAASDNPHATALQGNLALVPELYSYGRRADLTAARELAQQLLCSAQPDSDAPEWRVLLLQRYAHSKLAALSFLHRVAPAHVAAPALLSIDHSHERCVHHWLQPTSLLLLLPCLCAGMLKG